MNPARGMICAPIENVCNDDVEVSAQMGRTKCFGAELCSFRRVAAMRDLRTNFVKPFGKGSAQAVVFTRHQDTFAGKFRQWFSPGLASADDFAVSN